MRKTETVKVEEPIKRIFKQYGCYVYKNVQNVFTERGRPDLTACVPVKIKKAKGLWFKEQDPLVIKLLLERLKVHKEED